MRNRKLIALLSVVAVLVIAVVVCGATFLVRHVDAYGYYENSEEYDARVVAAADVTYNSSIFFLDEQAVRRRVENTYYNIGVINVERKFPDRVQINYVVYGNSFQYKRGDAYYQCYASGRIGGTTALPMAGGFFTLVPKCEPAATVGSFFDDGYDSRIVKAFIDYMYSTGLTDRQIAERISFIDLSREGYVYIRTQAGLSIEICGTESEFVELLDDGWSCFAYPDPEFLKSKTEGRIRVQYTRLNPDSPRIQHVYTPVGTLINGEAYEDDAYYYKYYNVAK